MARQSEKTPMADYQGVISEYDHRKQVGSHVDVIRDDEDSGRLDDEVEIDSRSAALKSKRG